MFLEVVSDVPFMVELLGEVSQLLLIPGKPPPLSSGL